MLFRSPSSPSRLSETHPHPSRTLRARLPSAPLYSPIRPKPKLSKRAMLCSESEPFLLYNDQRSHIKLPDPVPTQNQPIPYITTRNKAKPCNPLGPGPTKNPAQTRIGRSVFPRGRLEDSWVRTAWVEAGGLLPVIAENERASRLVLHEPRPVNLVSVSSCNS